MDVLGGKSGSSMEPPLCRSGVKTRLNASFRREHHQHLPAFHARMLLDLGGLGDVRLDPLEQPHAELAMGELAAAEAQRDLHLVALAR